MTIYIIYNTGVITIKCEYCCKDKTVGYIEGNAACDDCISELHKSLGLHELTIKFLNELKEGN